MFVSSLKWQKDCDNPGSAVQASVDGLESSVLYQFWMQAVTAAGPGDATDIIRIITPAEKPSNGKLHLGMLNEVRIFDLRF